LALRWLKVLTSPRLLVYLWLEKMRFAAKPGRRIVVTSPSLRDIMVRAYPKATPMLEVLVPGVAQIDGPASLAEKLTAREALGLPRAGHCVLFVANDYKKKGLDALLNAMQRLPIDTYLAVVGNPIHILPYRQLAQSGDLESQVFFLGSLKEMDKAYAAADCLAHPTLEDTFAMVVLEAMSHGLPVVVSSARYCGISGLLLDNANALILNDPGDPIAIALHLEKVLGDTLLKRSLLQKGIAFAEGYLWSQIAVQQEQMYAAVSVPL
jgi:glycosyltransferase involved in cell wall biosynthesis